jgi:Spy/CpxP family protein refolding chaperone
MAKFVVILGFILSFAAGMVIGSRGVLVSETTANPTPNPTTQHSRGERRGPSGYLTAELGLLPEQREQLDRIWSSLMRSNDREERDDLRRQYRRDRDEAIADLVPPERLGDYDRIIEQYQGRIEELERASRQAYESAVEQTKQILTPEQRARYEALLKRHRWGPGTRDRHSGQRGDATTRATSQPGRMASPLSSSASSHE